MLITFDFETTNHSYGNALDVRNRIVMVSWRCDDDPAENYTGDIMDAKHFWADLNLAQDACAYNCKFEQGWLIRLGFDIDQLTWHDPMLGEKVLLGNIQKPMNLGDVCLRYGYPTKDPLIDALMKSGVCPSEMPEGRLRTRCNLDVATTHSLHRAIIKKLQDRQQIHLYRNRCEFSGVLAHIESEGMLLDKGRVDEEYVKHAKEFAQAEAQLNLFTGGINLNSPDQKAHYFYDKAGLGFKERRGFNKKPLRNKPSKQFPKGRPRTNKDTIMWLSTQATTANQKDFFELLLRRNKLKAALSKNLDFFQGVCKERNSRFHAQFNQVVAATHRLSSSGIPIAFEMFGGDSKSVQFQNMPRAFKRCFKAPEGYVIAEVDAMQLEFRVAAFVGNDKQARKDIADPDFDAHCRTASVLNDLPYMGFLTLYREGDSDAKRMRQEGKPDTFKPLYGGTKGTPQQEKYYKAFAERYSNLADEQDNWLADVQRDGKICTPWGMVFSWGTYTKPNGMVMDKRTHKPVRPQVCNYPVQNLATAEIVPIAIVALYKRCKEEKLDVIFVNTIHDSVIVYLRYDPANIAAFKRAAEWAFTTAVYDHLQLFYGIEFDVPLGMEMVTGDHWNEGTEHIYDDIDNWKDNHE